MPEIRGTWKHNFDHAHERMKVAVESLVESGSMSERLGHALHTMSNFLNESDFPEGLKQIYKDIIAECSTASPEGSGSAFDATIRRMGYRKKKEIAGKIVYLYDEITRNYCLPESLN
jgi:hypothetical protein